jgi:hypothetical protein
MMRSSTEEILKKPAGPIPLPGEMFPQIVPFGNTAEGPAGGSIKVDRSWSNDIVEADAGPPVGFAITLFAGKSNGKNGVCPNAGAPESQRAAASNPKRSFDDKVDTARPFRKKPELDGYALSRKVEGRHLRLVRR